MANNVKYSFQIGAETSQAQKAINELNDSLNKLQKMAYVDISFDKDILQAADAAKVLQRELSAATNVKTGKLDMVEFAAGLRAAGTSVDDLSQKLLLAGKTGQQAFQGMVSTLSAADVPIKKMNATLSNALTTLKNTIKWEASSTMVHGLEGAFSSALSYAKNLNTSLTNIRIVTGQTIDDMAKFTVSANKAAKELSTTTKAYADAALIYYQQGDSTEQVAKKAAITIKAANASANTSAAEMSEYLTAVWNSYQVGADELERYVDIMAALGAKTATSLEEIATSMQKVAATGNTVGVSMEQVSSIIATVSSVTRESAESIGTSYKTIFARMGDLKLGETDEDGVGLGQVSSALESIGVQVLDAQGQLRDMGDIVTDLGDKWQTMNGAQKTAIAQVVAGKRQYTQLMALFENWDMYKDNMAIAGDAEGSLQNMADIYAESWEGASARVKAATEGIYGQLINDQSMIKMTNSFADMLGGIEGIIKGMGGLGGVITHFGAIASTVFKSKIAQSVDTTVEKLVNFKNSFQGKKGIGEILKSAFGETTGLRQYKAELKELQGQLGTIGSRGDAGLENAFKADVLQDIISSKEKLLELESKMTPLEKQRAQTSIDSLNKELANVDNLNTEWEDYNKSLNKTMNSITSITEQYKAFNSVNDERTDALHVEEDMQERINYMFQKKPQMASSFNNQNLFGQDLGEGSSLKDLINRYKDLSIVSQQTGASLGDLDNAFKGISGTSKIASENLEELKPITDILDNLKTTLNKNNLPTTWLEELTNNLKTSGDTTGEALRKLKEDLNNVFESTSKMAGTAAVTLSSELGISSDKLLEIAQQAGLSAEALTKLSQAMKNVSNNADRMNDELGQKGKKSFGEYFADFTSGAMNAMSAFNSFSSLVENFDSGDVSDKIGSIADSALEIGTALASGNFAAAIGSGIGAIVGTIAGAIDKHNKELEESIKRTNEIVNESTEELNTAAESSQQAYENYKAAQEARDQGTISQEEFLSSVDAVLAALDIEAEKVKALTGDYEGLAAAIQNAYQSQLKNQIAEAENNKNTAYRTLKDSLDNYSGEGADKTKAGKINGLKFDGYWSSELHNILSTMGFVFDAGRGASTWQGSEEDLPELRDAWYNINTQDQYKEFRKTEPFFRLQDWMGQFDSYFAADDTFMKLSASNALSRITEADLLNQTDENIYDYIINAILKEFGETPETATDLQKNTAQNFALSWISGFNEQIQTAFLTQSTVNTNKQTAQAYAKKYNLTVSENATQPSEFLIQDLESNQLVDGLDPTIKKTMEQYQLYSSLIRSLSQGTDGLEAAISASGINQNDYSSLLGINLEGQTLNQYLVDASEKTKNNIRESLSTWLIQQAEGIEKTFSTDVISTERNKLVRDKKQRIETLALDFESQLLDSNIIFQTSALFQDKQTYEKYQKHWLNLERDEKGLVKYDNWDYLNAAFGEDSIEANIFGELIHQQQLYDFNPEAGIDIESYLGADSYFSALFADIEAIDVWANNLSEELSSMIKDEGFKKSKQDFGQLKDLAADLQWSENEQAVFGKMAYGYGVDISEWQYKDQAVRSEEAYNVMRGAFDQKYAGKTPSKETDINGYQNYLEDIKALSAFTEERFIANAEQLNSELDTNINLLDSFANTDLTQPLQEEAEVAKLLQTTLNLSVENFNKLAPPAKNIQLLKAEQKLRENYRDSLQAEYNTWLATDEVKALIAEKDAETLEAQRKKQVQIAQIQADVSTTAKEISSSYKELNDTKIGQIADKWEQANESAEKLSTKAEVLSGAFESGELSAQDETILALNTEADAVKITAEAWAGYSAQKKAEIAAQAQYAATKATTDQLTTEQKAITAAQTQLTAWFDNTAKTFSEQDLASKIIDPDKFEEYLSGLQIPDDGLKPLREVYNKAIEKLGKDAKAEDIIIEMQAILKDEDIDLTALINQANAAGQDAISGILSGLSDEIQSKAQEAVDAWISAFETIADARDALIKGEDEDLWSQLAGDPDKLQQLFKQYKQIYQDTSLESFISGIIGGTITESDLPQIDVTSDNYLQNRYKEEGFVYDLSDSRTADIQDTEARIKQINPQASAEFLASETREYYTNLFKAATDLADDVIAEKVTDILGSDAEKGNAAYQELMSAVDERKLAIAGTEQFRALTLERQETLNAAEFASNVDNLTINAQGQIKTIDKNGQEAWQDTGLARQDGQVASYEEWTQLQSAIDRAQEAKYAGESWESLSEEDRQLLGQYGIDFSNVDTAAASCASALSACAAAASALAQAAAGAGGYTEINGEWGKQTTYTDEQGKAIYGDQWESIRQSEGWTANEDGSYTSGWNKDNEMTNLMNQSNQVLESAKAIEVDTQAQTFEKMASQVGMTADGLKAYCDRLVETNEITDDTNVNQMDMARSLARMDQGFKKAKSSMSGYMKVLKESDKASVDYSNTIEQVRDVYADLFDLNADEAKGLSDTFLESAENAKLLEDAIKGDEDAWDSLKKNAAKDLFADVGDTIDSGLMPQLDALAEEISTYDFGDLEIGASLETADFYAALDGMIIGSQAAADAISAGLSTMGVDAQIVEHTQPVPPKTTEVVIQNGSYTWPDGNGGLITIPLSATIQETDGGQVYTWYTIEGANYNGKGVTRGGGGGGSSGGGGGGGKQKQKKEHKRPKDEKERYHKNKSTINQVSNALEKLEKLKDRAYGKDYVDKIDEETEALKRQLAAQEALKAEAEGYVHTDGADLIAAGAILGEDGVIQNYDALVEQWVAEYNAAVDAWNNSAQEEDDEEAFKKAEQLFEDRMQLIEDYEDALQTMADAEAEIEELRNQMSENALEKITYTLELNLDVNERDVEFLDYLQDKYDGLLNQQDELFASLIQEASEYESNLISLQQAYDDLVADFQSGTINEAHFAEGLEELHSQMMENLQNMQEIKDEIAEVYANTLELAAEEIDKANESFEHMNETMESFISIMGLAGRETDFKELQVFYDAQYANNLDRLNVQTAHLAALREEEARFREKIEQDGELTDLEKEQYEALKEQIRETQSAVLATTEETLEALRAGYENTINAIAQDLDEFMAGSAGSLAHLADQYAYFQQEQERYVSTAKELSEVSKLNRDIEGTLATTTSAASKEALKALQEKINKQSELNQLTEYDIEMNQLEYQLLLARIQLEESQNAKDTVRLTRDDNGNYAYQYTADQNKVDEAMQNYEDTLQQMNDLTAQRTSEIEQGMINSMQEYQSKMQEIALDTTLTEEEKYARMEELYSQFSATMAYWQEQGAIATENLMYNQEAIAEHYGVNMAEITASTAGNVNEQIQSMIQNAQQYSQAMYDALFGEEGVSESWAAYLEAVANVTSVSGTSYGNMLEGVAEMGAANEETVQAALDTIEALSGTLEPIAEMTDAWNAHAAALEATIAQYEALANAINTTMAAIGETDTEGGVNTNTSSQTKAGHSLATNDNIRNEAYQELYEDVMDLAAEYYMDDLEEEMVATVQQYQQDYLEIANNEKLEAREKKQKLDDLLEQYTEAFLVAQADNIGTTEQNIAAATEDYKEILSQINDWTNQSMLSNYSASGMGQLPYLLIDQNVTITAEFPNITDENEIVEAFTTLINRAAQFASTKNL